MRRRRHVSAMSIARRALNSVDSELHFIDTQDEGPLIQNAPEIIQVNNIAAGNGQSNRFGQTNKARLITWRMTLFPQVTDAIGVRVMLVLDPQANGTTPTLAEILSDSGQPVTSLRQLNFSRRFRILYDRVFDMDLAHQHITRRVTLPLHFKARYSTGTAAVPQTNSLTMFILTDNTGEDTSPVLTIRIRFKWVG